MALNDAGKNVMLDAFAGVAVYGSLHDDDPSTTGANEISGGSPAYARKSITWGSAASASVAASNSPVFDVPGSTTVKYFGFFSASSGGTFYGSALVTNEAYGGQGTYTANSITVSLT
jgi:hypothetical protein